MNNNTLEHLEKASVDELRNVQFERIKQTLQHAYQNSAVYRQKFDEVGVHPDDFKTLADLAKFPFTQCFLRTFLYLRFNGYFCIWINCIQLISRHIDHCKQL